MPDRTSHSTFLIPPSATMYDVVVVGAGPGGATAAYHLARAGLRTLLLEKEKMPRYKPCGGGITTKVRSVLDYDFSSTVEDTIRIASVACRGERVHVAYDEPLAWMVMRARFDMLLAGRAADAGAEVRDGEPVKAITFGEKGATVTTRSATLDTRLVVGADGVNGIVRRAANFPQHQRMAVALEAEIEPSPESLAEWRQTLHVDFGVLKWGYAWIFPKAEHLSVGVGALLRPGHPLDLRAELARYVGSEPSLHNAKELSSRGHRIPLGGRNAKYHTSRALLVGDAAGVVDPFSAEGIYYAIRTGRMAAEEAASAFGRADSSSGLGSGYELSNYTRRVNAEINSDFRVAWWLALAFYSLPLFALRTFKRSKKTQSYAGQVLGGEVNYRQLASGLAKGFVGSLLPRRAVVQSPGGGNDEYRQGSR